MPLPPCLCQAENVNELGPTELWPDSLYVSCKNKESAELYASLIERTQTFVCPHVDHLHICINGHFGNAFNFNKLIKRTLPMALNHAWSMDVKEDDPVLASEALVYDRHRHVGPFWADVIWTHCPCCHIIFRLRLTSTKGF